MLILFHQNLLQIINQHYQQKLVPKIQNDFTVAATLELFTVHVC